MREIVAKASAKSLSNNGNLKILSSDAIVHQGGTTKRWIAEYVDLHASFTCITVTNFVHKMFKCLFLEGIIG